LKENKVLKFELSPQNLRIKNVLRNDFIAIDVYAISDVYPNRNNSHFTANSLRDAIPTFYNKPALGAFNVSKNDFKGHEMELRWDNELQQDYFDFTNGRCEVPLGVIRSEDLVEVIDLNGQTWVHFTCVLWAKYCYRQVKRLLKDQRKKISVEVEVLESHEDENGIEVIDKFTFDGFSLLGEDVIEAIPNAHLTILDKVNDVFYQKQEKCLSFAYKGLNNEDYDFALNENDIKDNNKDSFADDSGEIVDNEKKDEITMEHGEEESQKMTFMEKFELLNKAVGEGNWVEDFDDTVVYFQTEDRTVYKAPYSVFEDAEGHMTANVNMDEKVPVVRSWKEFSEEDNKETESVEENKEECSTDNQETESCENKEEESTENKEECSEENKECESEDADGCGECENEAVETECKFEEEYKEALEDEGDKKVESTEDCENCAEDKDKDADEEPKDEGEKENESAEEDKENECNLSAEENKEEMSADATEVSTGEIHNDHGDEQGLTESAISGIDTGLLDKHDEGSIQGKTYAVGDEQVTADELYVKFTAISTEFAALKEKYDALNTRVVAKQNDEFYTFACSLIDSEEDLSTENNVAIKAIFAESCKSSAYATVEAVQTAVDHSLADALYAQKKMSKAKKTEEFSVNINKSQSTSSEETLSDAQVLKNLNQKLRRI